MSLWERSIPPPSPKGGWVGQGDKDIICSYSLVVEQMTVNHQVGGSNPSKSAFKVKKIVIGLAYFSFREAVKL